MLADLYAQDASQVAGVVTLDLRLAAVNLRQQKIASAFCIPYPKT